MASEEAQLFLNSLLNKTLRIYITDRRIFVGQLKCTDKACSSISLLLLPPSEQKSNHHQDRNIILSLTHEYRHPSTSAVETAANNSGSTTGNVKVDMLKRFVGLVVVPGEYITKIEVED